MLALCLTLALTHTGQSKSPKLIVIPGPVTKITIQNLAQKKADRMINFTLSFRKRGTQRIKLPLKAGAVYVQLNVIGERPKKVLAIVDGKTLAWN